MSFDFRALRSAIAGPVFAPDDAGYDHARSIWNGAIDRRPAVIAECLSPDDVAAALAFARDYELEVAVRGGAHGYSGAAVCDGGMMINLGVMNSVVVDPVGGTARVGGGATIAEMDAATQAYGLAVPSGIISDTGVGGLTLGGGMGWLTRMYGLTIDNLVSAQVVLADGRIVRASDSEHPDLFWALRGGGGNFGVVTEFEYRTHELGPEVHVGLFFWPLTDGAAVLHLVREFIPRMPPRSGVLVAAGLSAPPEPFVPAHYHFVRGHALIVAGFGTAEEHAEMVAPIRSALSPLFEFVSPTPFTGLQSMLDAVAPWGIYGYQKALDLDDFSDPVIAVLTDQAGKKTSPLSYLPIYTLDGAFTDVGADDTAFGGARTAHYVCNMAAAAPDAEVLAADTAWVHSTWEALWPFAADPGGYINFMTEAGEDRVRASYGPAKYAKLVDIKTRYDPENVFHGNTNIEPG